MVSFVTSSEKLFIPVFSNASKLTLSVGEFDSRLLPDRVSDVKLHNIPASVIAIYYSISTDLTSTLRNI
ncbi:hypothetical protein QUB10_01400 [Microcoleus sp. B5-D4]|uniref:hypothetical protein n=1 Tax=Microcoleus sp. B6-A1 TaxID=2818684 RepID=UPI002FD398DA